MVEKILLQTDRAAAIVKRLSAFAGKGPSTKSLSDFNQLVDNAIAMGRNCLLDDPGGPLPAIRFEKELDPELPPVQVDPIQIEQVLINLVRNGIEATREAGCLAPIVIRTTKVGNALQVSVCDGGKGVPTSAEPHLFEPFFTTKPHGMGLGLSISRSIVESHGGVLWAENNAQGGATFFFTLPLNG
jgi:signal transduction histidine kinase